MAATVRRAIVELLQADAPLMALLPSVESIYHQAAPQEDEEGRGAFPFILIQKQGGTPDYSFGSLHEDEEWLVRAVDRDDSADVVDELALEIDRVLHDGALDVDDYDTLWFRRLRDFEMSEMEPGAVIHHKGANYSLIRAKVTA